MPENSGSDDLELVVDSQFRLARVSLKGEHADGAAYLDYLDFHTAKLRELAGDMSLAITGLLHLNAHVVQLVIETAVESFDGSLRTGIVSMAPNLIPIAIAMGVILHGFRVNYAESRNLDTAIAQTMQTTGRAVLFTTVVLTTGFAISGLATAEVVVAFGHLTALTVFLAFFLDLFLTPALLALVYRRRRNKVTVRLAARSRVASGAAKLTVSYSVWLAR